MKYLIFCLFLLTNCNKSEILNTLNWSIESENFSRSEIFEMKDGTLVLELNTNSLCPSYGIEVKIAQNETEVYTKKFSTLPIIEKITLATGSYKLTTKVYTVDNSSACVWFGKVNFSARF